MNCNEWTKGKTKVNTYENYMRGKTKQQSEREKEAEEEGHKMRGRRRLTRDGGRWRRTRRNKVIKREARDMRIG